MIRLDEAQAPVETDAVGRPVELELSDAAVPRLGDQLAHEMGDETLAASCSVTCRNLYLEFPTVEERYARLVRC